MRFRIIGRLAVALIAVVVGAGHLCAFLAVPAFGQTFTPQSPAGLSVTFTTEKAGGTRMLVFGEVRNTNSLTAQRIVLLAEGLDQDGRVVSRARGYVLGGIPSHGSATFEIRLAASGSERRYRVQIESYEFEVMNQRRGGEAP